jgi:predicted RNase H-like HicB family nuclease
MRVEAHEQVWRIGIGCHRIRAKILYNSRTMTYLVRLVPEDDGGYSVVVPGLPGCCSQGETKEEALDNIKEAIELYLEVLHDMGKAEQGSETTFVEVNVA